MNEITINNNSGELTVSSLQVAEHFGKKHKNVVQSIENLIEQTSAENSANLFIASTYCDNYGRQQKCYDLTRDGFSLLVMGFTGKDALDWKLKYIDAFNRMEQRIRQQPQMTPMEMIAGIATGCVELERRQNALETQVQSVSDKLNHALDVFTEPFAEADWNSSINRRISAVCERHHLNQVKIRHELYIELEQIAKCNLTARKQYKQKRMEKAGHLYREVKAVSKLDIIAEDPKLKAVFDGIVKRFEARYIQGDNVQLGMSLDDLIDF